MTKDSREAFTAAIEPHFTRLYRLAYRLTGSKSDAEDLLQDVLTKLYQRRDELSSIRELAPWLGRVLYNQFVDSRRRYGRQGLRLVGNDLDTALAEPPAAAPESEPLHGAERSEQLSTLQAALSRLSEEHRVVLLMHDSEGYKLVEIQELTGTPIGTLKSRLHRARARLRTLLAPAAPASGAAPDGDPEACSTESGTDGTFSASASCKPVDGVGNDAL